METTELPRSLSMVLLVVTDTPRNAYDIRDRMGLPRTSSAHQNVEFALSDLVRRGLIHMRPSNPSSVYYI